jgi:hypothetical protein
MKKLAVLSLMCLSGLSTEALSAYDPFDDATASGGTSYLPVGSNIYGQTNAQGLGWYQAGPGTGTQVKIAVGNLNIAGLPASPGNSLQFGGNGTSARFFIGGNVSSSTIYYSFAVKLTDITGMSTSGIFWAGFNNTGAGSQLTTPSTVATRVVTKASGGGYQIGLDRNSGNTTLFQWDPTVRNVNDELFLVGSYTFNPSANDDVSKLWVNPSSGSFGGSEPGGALVSTAGSADINQIASFIFFNRNAGEPASVIADELRIGSTWAEVTSVPEPGVWALAIMAGLGMLFRRFSSR